MAIENIFTWGVIAFVGVLLVFGIWKLRNRYRNRIIRDIFDDDRPH
jgi:uncharacterized membrane protein YjfL (UPF0719 family)